MKSTKKKMDKQKQYERSQELFRPLEFHPFDGPDTLPAPDPEDSRFTRTVLVRAENGGYAVAYYSYPFSAWVLEDKALSGEHLIFINSVRSWAYLPE